MSCSIALRIIQSGMVGRISGAADLAQNSPRIGFEEMQAGTAQTRELLTGETHLAHQAMRALRTTYESEQDFVEYVDGVCFDPPATGPSAPSHRTVSRT